MPGNTLNLNAHYGNQIKKVSIAQPSGGGGGYHIMIDNFYKGAITKIRGEWVYHFNKPILYAEDITVIGELLDEEFGE